MWKKTPSQMRKARACAIQGKLRLKGLHIVVFLELSSSEKRESRSSSSLEHPVEDGFSVSDSLEYEAPVYMMAVYSEYSKMSPSQVE